MTTRRDAGFSMDEALASSSFTPRRRDLPALVERLGADDEDLRTRVQRAIARLGPVVLPDLLARLDAAGPPVRARLVRTIAAVAAEPGGAPEAIVAVRGRLLALVEDPEPKTRRNAILALAKMPGDDTEATLLARWSREDRPEHRRSIADVLGRIGGERSLDVLSRERADEPELARILERAVLRLSRTVTRGEDAAELDPGRAPAAPVRVAVHCRAGLEPILADELSPLGARPDGPGLVELDLSGPLEPVLRARTMLSVGFPLPAGQGDVPEAIASALASDSARRVFQAWAAPGPIRWRLAWAQGGHRRALVLACARAVAARDPRLVNDPTDSAWDVVVDDSRGRVEVELVPRHVRDTRFAWRRRDVPAASHPTIAAALARVAGVRADDVVWDPFAGSGLELVERALLGPFRALHGTDHDPRAIEAARENLRAAGVHGATLRVADATRHRVPGVTLVLTNPPMGRRLARGTLAQLIDRFVAHVAEMLEPGGRLVWLSPLPRETRARARSHGLDLALSRAVDMGGFEAELEVWVRPAQTGGRRTRAMGAPGSPRT